MAYNDENQGSYGSTLVAFLLGVAVGGACAMLYSPMSGRETRAQIAEKAGAFKDKAADLKDQVVEKANQWKEVATSKMQGMADRAADTMDAAKDGATNIARTAKREMSNVENASRG
jgi:gas vesicle protein